MGCDARWKWGCCYCFENCCVVNNLWYNARSFLLPIAFQVYSDQRTERSSHTGTHHSRAVPKMVVQTAISMISDRLKGMTDTDSIGGCVSCLLCVYLCTCIFISAQQDFVYLFVVGMLLLHQHRLAVAMPRSVPVPPDILDRSNG